MAPPSRERPHTRAAREAVERARATRDLGALRALADGYAEAGFGLAEPVDSDLVLASATALVGLQSAPELFDLLALLDEHVRALRPCDSDLAFILAEGWLAYADLPAWKELETEARRDYLATALECAGAISAADGRDVLGCKLAEELRRQLLAHGRLAEATAIAEDAAERFPGDPSWRALLLARAAEGHYLAASLGNAWRAVVRAEEALAITPASDDATRPWAEHALSGVRFRIEIASGLPDQAWLSLDREREACEAPAIRSDPSARIGLLLDIAALGMAQIQERPLVDLLEEIDAALAATGTDALPGAWRAQLRARRALLQDLLERIVRAPEPVARAWVEEALADPELDAVHRSVLTLRMVDLLVRAGDVRAAAERLASLGSAEPSELRLEIRMGVAAWRIRLAVAGGAAPAELGAAFESARKELGVFLERWDDVPLRAGGLGILEGSNRRLLGGALIEGALALGGAVDGPARALDASLAMQPVGSLARTLGAEVASVADVRARLLGPGQGLVLYVADSGVRLHVFALDAERVVHKVLAWRLELDPRPRELGSELESSPYGRTQGEVEKGRARFEALAAELARDLLPEEIRARLAGWKELYVVGTDLLGLPFDCLSIAGRPLGRSHAISTLPSVPVGLVLAARASGKRRDAPELLLVGAPAVTSTRGKATLLLADEERTELSAGFARRVALTGPDASWAELCGALARSEPDVLHLLVHGKPDLRRELTAGLDLPLVEGVAGTVWCEDVLASGVRFPAVVVLSACGAARGPRRSGDDGLAQLAGALFAREARCVLHAENEIALEPTVRLVAAFQRELLAGKSPAEALRVARAELVLDARFAHPFYEFSLGLTGLGLEPLFPRAK